MRLSPFPQIVETRTASEYTNLVEAFAEPFAITFSTLTIVKSIQCIWENAISKLALGFLADHLPPGMTITGVTRNGCKLQATIGERTAQQTSPQRPRGTVPQPSDPDNQCPQGMPVNEVHASRTPSIAAHIETAQAGGQPRVLTYLGPNNPLRDRNRDAACPEGKYTGASCNEYPYASTAEGGAGASTAPVPLKEQQIQGGQLKGFYGKIAPGQQFYVEVLP